MERWIKYNKFLSFGPFAETVDRSSKHDSQPLVRYDEQLPNVRVGSMSSSTAGLGEYLLQQKLPVPGWNREESRVGEREKTERGNSFGLIFAPTGYCGYWMLPVTLGNKKSALLSNEKGSIVMGSNPVTAVITSNYFSITQ